MRRITRRRRAIAALCMVLAFLAGGYLFGGVAEAESQPDLATQSREARYDRMLERAVLALEEQSRQLREIKEQLKDQNKRCK